MAAARTLSVIGAIVLLDLDALVRLSSLEEQAGTPLGWSFHV